MFKIFILIKSSKIYQRSLRTHSIFCLMNMYVLLKCFSKGLISIMCVLDCSILGAPLTTSSNDENRLTKASCCS